MMDIDWSKAPDGCTHFDPVDRNHLRQSVRSSEAWSSPNKCWEPAGWQYPKDLSTMPRLIKRPEWPSEGLPPVGITCERRFQDVEGSSWMGCIILAHGSKRIFYRDNCGDEFAHSLDEVQFRAFPTAEQIAAEERNSAIDDMVSAALNQSYVITPAQAKIVFERIYDAGYRKQEQK